MNILIIVFGLILIIVGILTITKKWLWLQQGLLKRPVHINKYTKYMGIIDIIIGVICIVLGVIYFFNNQSGNLFIVPALLLIPLDIFGEIKYHKND